MRRHSSSPLLPSLAIALNALIWGLSWWPLHQLQARGLHPLWATVLMYSVPVLAMLLWRRWPLKLLLERADLWWLMLAAGLTNTCFNWAVTVGDVIRVVILFYLMPVWAVLLSWWWLGERPTLMAAVRVVVALAGVTLVMQPEGTNWADWRFPWPSSLADVLALLGGLFFAATNVLLNRTADTPPESRVYAMFIGGIVLGTATAATALATGQLGVTLLPPLAFGWIALVVVFSMGFVISNTALQYGSARLSAHTMSLIMLLEVLFAAVSAAAMGTAQLTMQVFVGGALVMSAALMAAISSH
ncbi:MAG: DMT family transporter [Brachymonas denitrificans]|uniref:DMT family transporter n=1 Tax=Brachymonas denitrificans TaxID=28220 RepID=UPI00352EA9FF